MSFFSEIRIYYEDTDYTGIAYHANYLRYFERARDEAIGLDLMKQLFERGMAFHVHQVNNLVFQGAARHADVVKVESRVDLESPFRLSFNQIARKRGEDAVIVKGITDIVCIEMDSSSQQSKIAKIPEEVLDKLGLSQNA